MTTPTSGAPGAADDASAGASASSASGSGNPLDEDTLKALQAVMAAEHAALWAYGLVTAYDPSVASTVTSMVTSHQDVRDTAANLIVQGGATPVGPAPAYTTPVKLDGAKSALRLALVIESDCAMAWRAVIGATKDSTLRGTALSALTNCAMRMVTWRQAADDKVLTVPFPGAPDMND